MSDQLSGDAQPKVTAKEILLESWLSANENRKTIGLLFVVVTFFPLCFTLVVMATLPIEHAHGDLGQVFAVTLVFGVNVLYIGGIVAFLWSTTWLMQIQMGLRHEKNMSLRAKFAPLKLILRGFIAFFSLSIPLALFSLLTMFVFIPFLPFVVFLFGGVAVLAYSLPYLVGSVVKNSQGLISSIKIAHKNFKALYLVCLVLQGTPLLAGLITQIVFLVFYGTELFHGANVQTNANDIFQAFGIAFLPAMIIGIFCWLYGCICAAVAYKKIVGLPDSTSPQTISGVESV
ncbi:hypothetical protein ACTL6U_14415 [Rhodovibrionaceae bacterium A322]